MSDYTTRRAEDAERALDIRVAAWEAHRADYDREDTGQPYHVADGMELEPK